jgi:hypothetical protein
MTLGFPFRTLIHADWSVSPRKRWMARSVVQNGRWTISATAPAGDILQTLMVSADQPLLAGFDFPIGLPESYGRATGFADFPAFLGDIDDGAWDEFRNIARHPDEISLRRPFYPSALRLRVERPVRSFGRLEAIRSGAVRCPVGRK